MIVLCVAFTVCVAHAADDDTATGIADQQSLQSALQSAKFVVLAEGVTIDISPPIVVPAGVTLDLNGSALRCVDSGEFDGQKDPTGCALRVTHGPVRGIVRNGTIDAAGKVSHGIRGEFGVEFTDLVVLGWLYKGISVTHGWNDDETTCRRSLIRRCLSDSDQPQSGLSAAFICDPGTRGGQSTLYRMIDCEVGEHLTWHNVGVKVAAVDRVEICGLRTHGTKFAIAEGIDTLIVINHDLSNRAQRFYCPPADTKKNRNPSIEIWSDPDTFDGVQR